MSTYMEHSVESERRHQEKVQAARGKHGEPFAHERGSEWKPHAEPFLTRWMRGEIKLEGSDAQA